MLESIVAIAILSLSVSGVFSAVQQSLSQAITAKNEVKAFHLAQEAMETIRNKRDANQLSIIKTGSGNWLAGITQNSDDPCFFGKTCRVDATGPGTPPVYLYSCSGGWDSCDNLKQNQTTFLYNYTSGTDTNFKREVQIELINANEISVTIRISWSQGLINREFRAKGLLLNWI